MQVINSKGERETVKFERISERLNKLTYGLNTKYIDPEFLAKRVIEGLYDGVSTAQLDELSAQIAASLVTRHPDWGKMASRIAITRLHKKTSNSFSSAMNHLFRNTDVRTGQPAPLVSKEFIEIVRSNAKKLDDAIIHEHDFTYDFFGYQTLEKSYLLRVHGKIEERPQYLIMRVAIGIHGDDISAALETYKLLSEKWFTHATPTLFNAGTPKPQMSSCFLLTMKDDSIDGIYDTLKQCAKISQSAGGIGLSIHNIRAKGSYIKGTGGISNGIVPMLRNFDMTARYVDQGGGKRKGSIAIYLEPWHADIEDFLDLKKNHGKEEMRARDLFYAMWIPDLFMERAENNEMWSLFCPNEAPGLADHHGDDFVRLYEKYEREGKARRQVKAQELWFAIVASQIETGTPYILYKDAANKKSNQKNLGVIKSSNLCTEIIEYSSPEEVAVCNLASIALPKFIKVNESGQKEFDHDKLYEITKVVTRNLNKVIDRNHYPLEEAKNSNLKHRPIGIGVQGLADTFILLRMPFDSEPARKLNKELHETIYFAAMEASMELAQKDGPYKTFKGSPVSKGIFQFDMWGVTPDSGRWDWDQLKTKVKKHGVRNSLLVAPMPTASTSQILGNNECFEPYSSNIYTRRTLAGEFILVNRHLLEDLIDLGLWNDTMKQRLIAAKGSVQSIEEVPNDIKNIYRTVYEISQKSLIDMAADRGAYICQSQSMNLFVSQPSVSKLTSMHFHSWKRGLKTGIYYLRTESAADAIAFTVDKSVINATKDLAKKSFDSTQQGEVQEKQSDTENEKELKKTVIEINFDQVPGKTEAELACSLENGANCEMCSG